MKQAVHDQPHAQGLVKVEVVDAEELASLPPPPSPVTPGSLEQPPAKPATEIPAARRPNKYFDFITPPSLVIVQRPEEAGGAKGVNLLHRALGANKPAPDDFFAAQHHRETRDARPQTSAFPRLP